MLATVSEPNPLSRRWIYVWTFLTWLITFSFAIYTLVVFTAQLPSDPEWLHTRSDRVVKTLQCLRKQPWTGVYGVNDIYLKPSVNATFDVAGSTLVLDDVMRKMRCHGNKETAVVTPLTGGISNANAVSMMMNQFFEFSSPMCLCVYEKHKFVYEPLYLTKTSHAELVELGALYTSGTIAAGTVPGMPADAKVKNLARECYMPLQQNKPAEILSLLDPCVLAVSPFAVAAYCNTIASMFATLYLMHYHEDATATPMGIVHILAKVLFVALNLGIGIAVLVVSQQSHGMVFTVVVQGLGGVFVGSAMAYSMWVSWHPGDETKSGTVETARKVSSVY